MPRKRTTRIKLAPQSTTNIPLAEDVSISDKNEQLKMFLKDFDFKVKNTLMDYDNKKTTIIKFINTRFKEQIVQLPRTVANMTLKEFAEAGGTIEALQGKKHTSKLQMLDELKWAGAKETLKVEESGLSIINEEDSEEADILAKNLTHNPKTRKRKMTTTKGARAKMPATTPCGTASRSTWGQTPLITPKFNPFLPLTPENERDFKPGERLMSLAGSPVRAVGQSSLQATQTIKAVNRNQFATELANMGIDLTPNRAEKILELVSTKLVRA